MATPTLEILDEGGVRVVRKKLDETIAAASVVAAGVNSTVLDVRGYGEKTLTLKSTVNRALTATLQASDDFAFTDITAEPATETLAAGDSAAQYAIIYTVRELDFIRVNLLPTGGAASSGSVLVRMRARKGG